MRVSTSPVSGPCCSAASSCSSTNLFSSNSSTSTFLKRDGNVFFAIGGTAGGFMYRELTQDFIDWCQHNHFLINVGKTKEIAVNFHSGGNLFLFHSPAMDWRPV
ncbi:hypothetical protein AOLI_G00267250 [Acnodon oligacanthus]